MDANEFKGRNTDILGDVLEALEINPQSLTWCILGCYRVQGRRLQGPVRDYSISVNRG